MDEIGTEAKLDGGLGAKVKMCTPVHGLSVCLIAEKPESPCTGVHIFTFAINLVQFGFCTNLVQFRFSSFNKLVERTVMTVNGIMLVCPGFLVASATSYCDFN